MLQKNQIFTLEKPVSPDHFYGREEQIKSVRSRIGSILPQSISIVGFQHSGKSSLLHYIQERIEVFCLPEQKPIVVLINLQLEHYHTPSGMIEGIRSGIEQATGNPPWKEEQNDDPWEIEDYLTDLRDNGYRLIVLIDEFEQIGKYLEQFQDWGSDWRDKASNNLINLVIASLRPLDEIYDDLGLDSPFGNIFISIIMGAFTTEDWQKLVYDGFANTDYSVNDQDIALINTLANGLPYYTQLAASLLWEYREHSQVQTKFTEQAIPHFIDLWNNLRPQEQNALRYAAGVPSSTNPSPNTIRFLQRHGLLNINETLFSSAFAQFVRVKQ